MLSVLATIGKIILISLLVILAILIILLLLVLFVPVRYKGSGHFDSSEKPVFFCDIRASYLLHLLSVRYFTKEEKQVLTVKILGISLKSYRKFFGRFHRREKNLSAAPEQNENHEENQTETVPQEENACSVSDIARKTEENGAAGDRKHKTVSFAEIKARITGFTNKIRQLFRDGQKLKKKCKRIYRILSSDLCKRAFRCCKERLFKLLRAILPRKALLEADIGFSDPAATGNLLAVHGILYPLLGDIIVIHPYFEEEVMRGKFHFKGRIRLGILLYHVLRVVTDENCKRFYRIVKKETAHGR